ncbi:UNVERIFIED_CONTAM: hypothetical protein GTU68_061246 [Idotea baltica]|nr:hypothetical protein [Idotea baltica]
MRIIFRVTPEPQLCTSHLILPSYW